MILVRYADDIVVGSSTSRGERSGGLEERMARFRDADAADASIASAAARRSSATSPLWVNRRPSPSWGSRITAAHTARCFLLRRQSRGTGCARAAWLKEELRRAGRLDPCKGQWLKQVVTG